MKTYEVKDCFIAIFLTSREAKAILSRLEQHTGVKKSKELLKAEQKILNAVEKA